MTTEPSAAGAFKTIMVGMDGSEGANRALHVALSLADHYGAEVVLAHVAEKLAAKGGPDTRPDEDEIQTEIRRRGEELSVHGRRVRVEMESAMGTNPAHAVADLAERVGADLIVLGTRGKTAFGGLLLGGVTQRVLHLSHTPVLAVPPER